jgi:hypothetical protein
LEISPSLPSSCQNKKFVGIRYTNDTWKTLHESACTYVRAMDAYEIWMTRLPRGIQIETQLPAVEYEIAAFASFGAKISSNVREWDPNNNYYVYAKATPAHPVGTSTLFATYEAKTNTFSGLARTWRAADGDAVFVRWSSDDWATVTESAASPAPGGKNLWTWSITVPAPSIQFVVKLVRAEGRTFWDNNNGKNYSPIHKTF